MSKNRHDGVADYYKEFLTAGTQQAANFAKMHKQMLTSMYLRVLTELSANRFEWKNLPSSIDERYLELGLITHGGMLFYDFERIIDTDGDMTITDSRLLVQPFTNRGRVNHYNNPTKFTVSSQSGVGGDYTPDNAVPIWGNYMHTPDVDIITVYANRLAEIDMTSDVTVKNVRHPRVVVMDEASRLTMENIDRQIEEGVPVIKVSSLDPVVNYTSLDLGTDHSAIPAIISAKGRVWNEALTMLGVPAVNQEKKERLITSETDNADEQSEVIRNIALNSRREACKQINRVFAHRLTDEIWVDWRAQSGDVHNGIA